MTATLTGGSDTLKGVFIIRSITLYNKFISSFIHVIFMSKWTQIDIERRGLAFITRAICYINILFYNHAFSTFYFTENLFIH